MKTIQDIYFTFIKINVNNLSKDFYTESYPDYLNYFSAKNQLTKQDLIIGIGLVYSWMPTIPKKTDFKILDQALLIVNKVKQGNALMDEEYKILKKCCNNSLVGASKLLHFVNPERYAIWDSRIYSFLYQDPKGHKYKVENIEKYIDYLALVNQIAQSTEFKSIIRNTQALFDYKISKYRAIEWMFFKQSKDETK